RSAVVGQHLELGGARRRGELVPRAHGEAVVAAKNAVADGGAELGGDVALVLAGQVGDAAARIALGGRRKSARRADVETAAAAAAMVTLGSIGRKLGGSENGAEQQPGAELARHQVGVLSLPTQSRGLSERLLHQRCGIDEDLHLGARSAGEAAG